METTLAYPITNTQHPPLLAAVGSTPLLPIDRIAAAEGISPAVRILAKAEWFNPGGSIKDRPARRILLTALENGLLDGKRLLDSTSGNMGIAYATLAPVLSVAVTLTVPENASPERLKILRLLGAEIILTDPLEGSDGAILAARELAGADPARYYYADQYNNPANWKAHYETTGPEILADTNGELTHFVAGLGTTGTLVGTGRYLREHAPGARLVAFQPDSPFHGLEGLKHMESAIVPGIYDPDLADENRSVRTEDAHEMTRRLAREEGLFAGISSGAALVAALAVARDLDQGVVVTVFPDAGYKYLTDRLWEVTG
jgi:cysteine synthase B